jgi:bis(5'-nucleosyl)-tetraphosphatase (symmetrical)
VSKRRIFIGDVQGCRTELETLLERVAYDPAGDELQPVGDLVNRGPDSLGCLRLMRSLGARGVLGNHDLHLLRVAAGARTPGKWDTLDDVLRADDREELCAWLAALPFIRVFPDAMLVHAGLHPLWTDPEAALAGLDPLVPDPASDFATRVRYCSATGERPESDWPPPKKPFRPWFDWCDPGERTVVFGHWAQLGLVEKKHLRGLDTGCVWGGRLTAWIAEEDRLVHVAARRAYADA